MSELNVKEEFGYKSADNRNMTQNKDCTASLRNQCLNDYLSDE